MKRGKSWEPSPWGAPSPPPQVFSGSEWPAAVSHSQPASLLKDCWRGRQPALTCHPGWGAPAEPHPKCHTHTHTVSISHNIQLCTSSDRATARLHSPGADAYSHVTLTQSQRHTQSSATGIYTGKHMATCSHSEPHVISHRHFVHGSSTMKVQQVDTKLHMLTQSYGQFHTHLHTVIRHWHSHGYTCVAIHGITNMITDTHTHVTI